MEQRHSQLPTSITKRKHPVQMNQRSGQLMEKKGKGQSNAVWDSSQKTTYPQKFTWKQVSPSAKTINWLLSKGNLKTFLEIRYFE